MECEERRIETRSDAEISVPPLKIAVPFEGDEKQRFEKEAADRNVIVRQLTRKLLLAWMDPSTGPIIEAAMRGRPIPDLSAVSAQETASSLAASGAR